MVYGMYHLDYLESFIFFPLQSLLTSITLGKNFTIAWCDEWCDSAYQKDLGLVVLNCLETIIECFNPFEPTHSRPGCATMATDCDHWLDLVETSADAASLPRCMASRFQIFQVSHNSMVQVIPYEAWVSKLKMCPQTADGLSM